MDQTIVIEATEFQEGVDAGSVLPSVANSLVDGKLKSPRALAAMVVAEEIAGLIAAGNKAKVSAVESKRVRFQIEGEAWKIEGSFRKGDLAY